MVKNIKMLEDERCLVSSYIGIHFSLFFVFLCKPEELNIPRIENTL